jgi:cytochrome P450
MTTLGGSAVTDPGEILAQQETSQNPYAAYRAVRDAGPAIWSDVIGSWLVGGYNEVKDVLMRSSTFSSSGIKGLNVLRLPDAVRRRTPLIETIGLTPALVFSDPPIHTKHRRLVNRPLVPRAIASRKDWLESLCNETIDAMAAKDLPDVVNDLALPLSLRIVVELFGGVAEDMPLYLELSQAQRQFFAAYHPSADVADATEAVEGDFYEYVRAYLALKREQPDDSLLSALVRPDGDGTTIDDKEIFVICHVFLTAAYETTAAAIGSMFYALLTHEEELARVLDDAALVRPAFEELVRWESPIQKLIRIAQEDTQIGGQPIAAGDPVTVYLSAANRDPRVFDDPDRFDIGREGHDALAFGRGIHFCVGAGLARLEGSTATRLLLERFPNLRIADGWTPLWTRYPQSRMLDSLPVTLAS